MPRIPRSIPRPLFLALVLAFAPHGVRADIEIIGNPADGTQTVIVTGNESGKVVGNSRNGRDETDVLPALGHTLNILSGARVDGYSFGAYFFDLAGPANASGNTVNFAGTADNSIYGGYAESENGAVTASDNRVYVSGGTVEADVYGSNIYSENNTATALDNHVNISGGTVTGWVTGGKASSGNNTAVASDNHVNITAGSVDWVMGGNATSYGTATASNNHVNIFGGTINGHVRSGDAYSDSSTATASGNHVNIFGGTLNEDVSSGYADSDGAGQSGNATDNFIVISGGEIRKNVFGGYSLIDPFGETGTATHNTVTLIGQPVFGATSILYGGVVGDGYDPIPGMDASFTGNRLEIKTAGLQVGGIQNFEYLDFHLPPTLGADETVLTVTGIANLTNGVENDARGSRSSVVNVGIDGASSPLKTSDRLTLIDAGTLIVNDGLNDTARGYGTQGIALQYEFDIRSENDRLLAVVTKVGVKEQTRALSESFLSGSALLGQSVDLAAGKGMAAAQDALRLGRNTFIHLEGGRSRYDTGSRLDVDGKLLMAGVAGEMSVEAGMLTLGAFLAHGRGDYETRGSFATDPEKVRGKGDTEYTGLGLLARLDFAGTDAGHPYAEASFQSGRVKTDFRSSNLVDAKYDSASKYYGAYLGAGYVWNIARNGELDLYGQLFHVRRGGDRVELGAGDPIRFKAVESKRVRIGGRYRWANETVKPYAGLAWEHEFDGKAKATAYGYEIDAPDMKGDTGIVELGLTLAPGKTQALTVDLGIQGYGGQRKGVSGSLRVEYRF